MAEGHVSSGNNTDMFFPLWVKILKDLGGGSDNYETFQNALLGLYGATPISSFDMAAMVAFLCGSPVQAGVQLGGQSEEWISPPAAFPLPQLNAHSFVKGIEGTTRESVSWETVFEALRFLRLDLKEAGVSALCRIFLAALPSNTDALADWLLSLRWSNPDIQLSVMASFIQYLGSSADINGITITPDEQLVRDLESLGISVGGNNGSRLHYICYPALLSRLLDLGTLKPELGIAVQQVLSSRKNPNSLLLAIARLPVIGNCQSSFIDSLIEQCATSASMLRLPNFPLEYLRCLCNANTTIAQQAFLSAASRVPHSDLKAAALRLKSDSTLLKNICTGTDDFTAFELGLLAVSDSSEDAAWLLKATFTSPLGKGNNSQAATSSPSLGGGGGGGTSGGGQVNSKVIAAFVKYLKTQVNLFATHGQHLESPVSIVQSHEARQCLHAIVTEIRPHVGDSHGISQSGHTGIPPELIQDVLALLEECKVAYKFDSSSFQTLANALKVTDVNAVHQQQLYMADSVVIDDPQVTAPSITALDASESDNNTSDASKAVQNTGELGTAALYGSYQLPPVEASQDEQDNHSLSDTISKAIEKDAFETFYQMFNGKIALEAVAERMSDLASYPKNSRESRTLVAMISTLVDECKYFSKYPMHQLSLTAKLLGLCIKQRILENYASVKVTILKMIIDSLKMKIQRPKLLIFGFSATGEFLEKFPEMPVFVEAFITIENSSIIFPEYHSYAQQVWNLIPDKLRDSIQLTPAQLEGINFPPPPPNLISQRQRKILDAALEATPAAERGAAGRNWNGSEATGQLSLDKTKLTSDALFDDPAITGFSSEGTVSWRRDGSSWTAGSSGIRPQVPLTDENLSLEGFGLGSVENLLHDHEILNKFSVPPSTFCNAVAAIFNSLAPANLAMKAANLQDVLRDEYFPWLAFYLVKCRASKEENLHGIFNEVIDKVDGHRQSLRLLDVVTSMTFDCLSVLFKYIDAAKEMTSYRTVVKNLASWLGTLTLARDRPILSKNLDLKLLLFDAYDNKRMIVVVPLICKVLNSIKHSKNFQPPNPWTVALLNILAEIHSMPGLRTSLVFEVEVFFKNTDLVLSHYSHQSDALMKRTPPPASADFIKYPPNAVSSVATNSAAAKPTLQQQLYRAGQPGGPAPGLGSVVSSQAGTQIDSLATPESVTSLSAKQRQFIGMAPGSSIRVPLPMASSAMAASSQVPTGLMRQSQQGERFDPLQTDETLVRTFAPSHVMQQPAKAGGVHGSDDPNMVLQRASQPKDFATAADSDLSAPPASEPDTKMMAYLTAHVVISPAIALFQIQPELRSIVPRAVYASIKEIIKAVVQRSVTIGCVATREIVSKDFNDVECKDDHMKRAAQLMVATLSGCLALTTCKEPLRIFLTCRLRQELNQKWLLNANTRDTNTDRVLIEQVIQVVSADNIDIGCSLIEQAVVEKALVDIESDTFSPIVKRRFLKGSGTWDGFLPKFLKPHDDITSQHLQVYKDFLFFGPLKRMSSPQHPRTVPDQSALALAAGRTGDMPASMTQQGYSAKEQTLSGSAMISGLDAASRAAAAKRPTVGSTGVQQGSSAIIGDATQPPAPMNWSYDGQSGDIVSEGQHGAMKGPPAARQLTSMAAAGATGSAFGAPMPTGSTLPPPPTTKYADSMRLLPSLGELDVSIVVAKVDQSFACVFENVKNVLSVPPIVPDPRNVHYSSPYGACEVTHDAPRCFNPALLIFASLPSDHILLELLLSIPEYVNASKDRPQVANRIAQKVYKIISDSLKAPSGQFTSSFPLGDLAAELLVEVSFGILAGLKKVDPETWQRISADTAGWLFSHDYPMNDKVSREILLGLLRYDLLNLELCDRWLAKQFANGENLEICLEFLYKTILLNTVSPSSLPLSVEELRNSVQTSEADSTTPQYPRQTVTVCDWQPLSPNDAKLRLLEGINNVIKSTLTSTSSNVQNPKRIMNLTQLLESYDPQIPVEAMKLAPPVEIEPNKRMALTVLFQDWLRICSTSRFDPSAEQSQFVYFKQLSNWNLLHMDDKTILFFGACIEVAVEVALNGRSKDSSNKSTLPGAVPGQASGTDKANPETEAPMDSSSSNQKDGVEASITGNVGGAAEDNEMIESDKLGASVDLSLKDTLLPTRPTGLTGVGKNEVLSTKAMDVSYIDSLVEMVVCMARLANPEHISATLILQKFLAAVARVIHKQADNLRREFNQRPFFRLLLLVMTEFLISSAASGTTHAKPLTDESLVLVSIAQTLQILNPMRVPAFAFAWLALISHNVFLPKMLQNEAHWALFNCLFSSNLRFLYPFIFRCRLTSESALLFKATFRISLVVLHDFPEFFCEYAPSLACHLPLNCVQLRNVFLSSFPRNMRLPDPFFISKKDDLANVGVSETPCVCNCTLLLKFGIRVHIDSYLKTRDNSQLESIIEKLKHSSSHSGNIMKYNISAINAMLSYLFIWYSNRPTEFTISAESATNTPASDFIHALARLMDIEGRFELLTTLCNHVRFPNHFTRVSGSILLLLFNQMDEEFFREQLTRVVIERLVAEKPHPWGLFVIFTEIVKNPLFWNSQFVHSSPEVEVLLRFVSGMCLKKTKPTMQSYNNGQYHLSEAYSATKL